MSSLIFSEKQEIVNKQCLFNISSRDQNVTGEWTDILMDNMKTVYYLQTLLREWVGAGGQGVYKKK